MIKNKKKWPDKIALTIGVNIWRAFLHKHHIENSCNWYVAADGHALPDKITKTQT